MKIIREKGLVSYSTKRTIFQIGKHTFTFEFIPLIVIWNSIFGLACVFVGAILW